MITMQNYKALKDKYAHLEFSILPLSSALKDNETKRLDSEYFKKEYFENEEAIKKSDYLKLKDLCYFICNGDDCREYTQIGKKYIRTGDIKDFGLDLDNAEVINSNFISKTRLEIGDLLITRKGNYGKSQVIDNDKIVNSIISSEIFQLKLKNINPYFVDIFLKSSYGQLQFEKHIHGVSNFSITQEALLSFLIPLFDSSFQKDIEKIVKDSHHKLEQSKALYKEAESLLYESLAMPNSLNHYVDKTTQECTTEALRLKFPHLNFSIKPLSLSLQKSGRLDSEYYQSKYENIEALIKSYKWSLVSLFFKQNKTPCNFTEEQYNYIEIGDINISDGDINFNSIPTNELPANAKIVVCKDDVLISKVRPNRGAVGIINFDKENLIASGAFTILREKGGFKKEVLQVLLRSCFYKELLLKYNVGTSYPVIKDDDILNLPIPLLDSQIQEQIASKLKLSFALKKEAKELLNLAKNKVEQAIESY